MSGSLLQGKHYMFKYLKILLFIRVFIYVLIHLFIYLHVYFIIYFNQRFNSDSERPILAHKLSKRKKTLFCGPVY